MHGRSISLLAFLGVVSFVSTPTFGQGAAGTGADGKSPIRELQATGRHHDDGCPGGPSHLRLLFGLEPEVVDSTTLALQPGRYADSTGCKVLTVRRQIRIDLTTTGLNGMDQGRPRPGEHYFVYLVTLPDGAAGAVVSSDKTLSSFNRAHRYASVRKLPWGFVYTDRGLAAVHVSYWPKPFTRYTEAATTPAWSVLESGASHEWRGVSVSRLVPDNARMAYLLIEVRHIGRGAPAAGYIRVVGSQGEGLLVGRVAGGTSSMLTLHQRITSGGEFYYRVEPGAVMNVWVLGYSNTEPS